MNSYVYISRSVLNNFIKKFEKQILSVELPAPFNLYLAEVAPFLSETNFTESKLRIWFYLIITDESPLSNYPISPITDIRVYETTIESKIPYFHSSQTCVSKFLKTQPEFKKIRFKYPPHLTFEQKFSFKKDINSLLAKGNYHPLGRGKFLLKKNEISADLYQKYGIINELVGSLTNDDLINYEWLEDSELIEQELNRLRLLININKEKEYLYLKLIDIAKKGHLDGFHLETLKILHHLGISDSSGQVEDLLKCLSNYLSALENLASLHSVNNTKFPIDKLKLLGFQDHECIK